MRPQKITLKTQDKQVLKANFFVSNKKSCVLLLHQFSKNKDSWSELIPVILNNHSVLSLDLRGHGESTGNFRDFKDEDFINMKIDVETAISFLKENNFEEENISIIGSSIGANLAYNYAASNPYDRVILLSPGKNYKGIELVMRNTDSLIIVSKEDAYSYKTVKEIEKINPQSECVYLNNKGHGVFMLSDELISSIHLYLLHKDF